jgi:hypothetical protein
MHYKMFHRLKLRCIEQITRELIGNPLTHRILFIGGRRRTESSRRASIPEMDRQGSKVFVSPMVNWTKPDMGTYRLRQGAQGDPVPVNQTADLIHMSGECLCGAYASPGERAEVSYWYPKPFDFIADLERRLAGRTDLPDHRKCWGWGADPANVAAEREFLAAFGVEDEEPEVGFMCSSCDARFAGDEPLDLASLTPDPV